MRQVLLSGNNHLSLLSSSFSEMIASHEDGEPGVPGIDTDEEGRPYFFPAHPKFPADSQEQWDGLTPRWHYTGHTDAIKSVCVMGEDTFGRMRFASTDGRGLHTWLELGDDDCVRKSRSNDDDGGAFENITSMANVTSADVIVAVSVRFIHLNADPLLHCNMNVSLSKYLGRCHRSSIRLCKRSDIKSTSMHLYAANTVRGFRSWEHEARQIS